DTDILSVSIITDESMYADALSTALYSLGLQKGMALINSLEGVDAIFIDNKHKIFLSKGLEEGAYSYTISDPQFSLGKIE
ncbi:MAG: FAD:protein FMN transferase, partial [Sphaerochaetaceae bacterium]